MPVVGELGKGELDSGFDPLRTVVGNTDGSGGGLTDPDNIRQMTPEDVLNTLFG